MTYTIRWRRAMMISVIFHLFFFAGSGYLAARLFAVPAVIEQFIELELASEPKAEKGANTEKIDLSAPPEPVPQPVRPRPAPVIQQPNPEPAVAAADSTPVAAAEVVTTAANTESTEMNSAPVIAAGHTGSNTQRGGVAPPGILDKVEPVYPQSARQAGIEGTVLLKIQVLENGRPGSISVSRSSGHAILDDAALAAVRQWRFVPAKDRNSGRAVVCSTTMPVSFSLK